ncbi:MAG: polysaccharide deacetylase family protein [Actinomycetota bacterium]|nr:polysaccharide deacetylase family protein [Actinomycetota bacterium]
MRGATQAATFLAGAAALHSAPALSWFFPVTKRFLPTLMGVRRAGEVAITFDDGPDPVSTPLVLDLLARNEVKATFFMLGDMAKRHPDVARAVAEGGHQVGVHGLYHRNALFRSYPTIGYDLERGKSLVEESSGQAVHLMRPPYGVLSTAMLVHARRLDLRPLLWTSWGRDWRAAATRQSIVSDLVRHGIDGGTILLHDSDCTSAPGSTHAMLEALEELLALIQARGLRTMPAG